MAASEDKLAWLERALERSSPHDFLRASLLTLLGEQKDPRVVDILRAWCADEDASLKARASAVRTLALITRSDSGTAELLAGFLDAPYALQSAAVSGLSISRTALARRALKDHYPLMIDPRQRRMVEASMQGSY